MKKIVSLVLALCLLLAVGTALTSCGNTAKVKIIDIPLTSEEYAFVVKKGNTDLKNDFNNYLASIKANGTFQNIVDKYFQGTGTKVGVDVATGDVTNDNTNLVVATNCPFEPFEYIGEDGKIYGIDIEIAKGYAESKGLTLVVKNIGFDDIFTQVDVGYADIGMAGITVTPERATLYDFSDTYYNASQKIIVMASNTDFDDCKSAEDVENVLKGLTDKKVGYQTGTTGNWYVAGDEDWGYDGFANLTPKGYDTAMDAIMDMKNGNLYAVVVDEAPGAAMVKGANK